MDEVCYISDKNKLPNNLTKRQYFYATDFISLLHFETKLSLSIEKVFQNIHFLPLFHYFQKWVRFVIFQVNADCLINQLKKIFTQAAYTPPLSQKHLRSPSQNPLETSTFIPFLLVSTVDEVCYIWHKYQPPNNLAKHQYFYTRDFIFLLHFKNNWRSPSQKFFDASTFCYFFTIFKSEWGLWYFR